MIHFYRYLFYLVFFLFVACSSSLENKPIDVSNYKEVVEVSDSSGTPMKASYFDKESNEKMVEREYHPGKKTFKEWSFKNGLKNGEARSFRKNGALWSLNTFTNDTLNGPYKTFHENGRLYIEGQYRMGIKSGVWNFYNDKGKLSKTFDFATMDSTMMRNH